MASSFSRTPAGEYQEDWDDAAAVRRLVLTSPQFSFISRLFGYAENPSLLKTVHQCRNVHMNPAA